MATSMKWVWMPEMRMQIVSVEGVGGENHIRATKVEGRAYAASRINAKEEKGGNGHGRKGCWFGPKPPDQNL